MASAIEFKEPRNVSYADDLMQEDTGAFGCTPVVRVDILHGFPELVASLGGDVLSLLAKLRINPSVLGGDGAVIPYRSYVLLMERAAAELQCPDFGMRLAAAQTPSKILGPVGVAMKNSKTFGTAFRYASERTQAYYSTAVRTSVSENIRNSYLEIFEILLPGLPHQRQAMEQALLLAVNNAFAISGGQIRPREVWLKHSRLAEPSVYQGYFKTAVSFERRDNALLFSADQFSTPLLDADEQLYMLATSYVEHQLPKVEMNFTAHVRAQVERLFKVGDFSHKSVAEALGMHSRTLRRRLQNENTTLEKIRDDVRRDFALHYLQGTKLPLIEVVKVLGFSEASVLSRSCKKWFSASPKELRRQSSGMPSASTSKTLEHATAR